MKTSLDVRSIYDSEYFLNHVDGFQSFKDFDGSFERLFDRFQRNIRLLDLKPQEAFLELGCGRGEVPIYHAKTGGLSVGVDFSDEAIRMARAKAAEIKVNVEFVCAPFQELEIARRFHAILVSEVIEHINPSEGLKLMSKCFDLLEPGGRLLVYTHPNTLQRKFGYPLMRVAGFFVGRHLPRHQPDTLDAHYRDYHLNEQSFRSLRQMVRGIGFKKWRVFYSDPIHSGLSVMKLLRTRSPLRHILNTGLTLIATK